MRKSMRSPGESPRPLGPPVPNVRASRLMAIVSSGIELFLTEIKVSDWAKSVRWYVETLGLRLVLDDHEHEYALLEAGRGRLALKGGSGEGLGRDGMRLIFQVREV